MMSEIDYWKQSNWVLPILILVLLYLVKSSFLLSEDFDLDQLRSYKQLNYHKTFN